MRVLDRLGELLDEGIDPSSIQVLSTSASVVERLIGRDVAGVGLVGYGDDGVAVETVQRFKGLEAEVVLLVIPAMDNEVDLPLVYTGLSRAQTFSRLSVPRR